MTLISCRRHARVGGLVAALIVAEMLWPTAAAATDIDRCNDVLKQDLFNRVTSTTQRSESARQAYVESFFSMDARSAFSEYQKVYDSVKKQETSGSGEGHYGLAGGSAEFRHLFERRLSQSEFEREFSNAKSEFQRSISSSSSKEASTIAIYSSSVRDATTIKAWERCMTTSTSEPQMFAYGYRDESGHPYVTILWAPGILASSSPTIRIRFVQTDPDVTIEGSPQVASGTGAVFGVKFKDPNGRKATSDGFAVLVNGEVTRGTDLLHSFRAEAIIPRNLGPTPCNLLLTPGRQYELTMSSAESRMFDVRVMLLTLEGEPARQGDSVVYHGRMAAAVPNAGKASPVTVRLTGSGLSIDFDGDPTQLPATGQCTGQHVRLAVPPTRFDKGLPRDVEWRIRPAQ